MICPHCNTAIHDDPLERKLLSSRTRELGWSILAQLCPECDEVIVYLASGAPRYDQYGNFDGLKSNGERKETRLWPVGAHWTCPLEVPDELREDFLEAAAVVSISSKASAALSRRCLQHLLREHAKTQSKDLSKQIDEVIKSHSVPSTLEGQLDAIRNIGNFAAHPQKDQATGEILPVEPAEAEWNLEVLQDLFDHYFVKPAQIRKRTEDLNKKLAAAGKPPIPI